MKKTCDTCGGSGQISCFKGVSRFLLSVEECDACNGIGFTIVEEKEKEGLKGKKKKTKNSNKN
jgi:DnaJ-class molecular chaperone